MKLSGGSVKNVGVVIIIEGGPCGPWLGNVWGDLFIILGGTGDAWDGKVVDLFILGEVRIGGGAFDRLVVVRCGKWTKSTLVPSAKWSNASTDGLPSGVAYIWTGESPQQGVEYGEGGGKGSYK